MPGIKDAKCVLVLGATSGIGRALALAIHDLDSRPTVIVSGRRQERLDELAGHGERIKTARVDINTSEDNLKKFVQDTVSKYPDLDAVIFSSGIQHIFDFTKPESIDLNKFQDEINTNYISIFKLIVMFLPHLLKLSDKGRPSFIVPISSGLSIVPSAAVPDYSATKAALHSLSISLRLQLAMTKVQVIEILPPLVESELHDHQGKTPVLSKVWMPLKEFTEHAMAGLIRGDPNVPVGNASQDFNHFEKGKQEAAQKFYERTHSLSST
ncbi:NAD-P-binding protein [Trametes sanguinea]|nr:NAD-P-binding protein [Trametes sanguinea]